MAVENFLKIMNRNAKILYGRISNNTESNTYVSSQSLDIIEESMKGALTDYSRFGCVDLRFQGVRWAPGLTAILLKSQKSLPGKPRC